MSKFFNAVIKGKTVGDGSIGSLVDWLEKYINVLFPENGIEYWSDTDTLGRVSRLKRLRMVPETGNADSNVHHVACYVRQGGSEGRIIEIGLRLRDGSTQSLSWVKSFGKEDECWEIARAVGSALDSILFYEEVPELVDMAAKLPRQTSWSRETTLTAEVVIGKGKDFLCVSIPGGQIPYVRSYQDRGDYAKDYVELVAKDWELVLANMKAPFKVVAMDSPVNSLIAVDLPRVNGIAEPPTSVFVRCDESSIGVLSGLVGQALEYDHAKGGVEVNATASALARLADFPADFKVESQLSSGTKIPPQGWQRSSEFTEDAFNRWGNKPYNAVFEKRMGGDGKPTYDLTILFDGKHFIPAHGAIVMPDRVDTAADAAAIALEWYVTEVEAAKPEASIGDVVFVRGGKYEGTVRTLLAKTAFGFEVSDSVMGQIEVPNVEFFRKSPASEVVPPSPEM